MADITDYELKGDDIQAVVVEPDQSEGVRAEVGSMIFMEYWEM